MVTVSYVEFIILSKYIFFSKLRNVANVSVWKATKHCKAQTYEKKNDTNKKKKRVIKKIKITTKYRACNTSMHNYNRLLFTIDLVVMVWLHWGKIIEKN